MLLDRRIETSKVLGHLLDCASGALADRFLPRSVLEFKEPEHLEMDWQRKRKRTAPPAPLRRASRARSSGKVVQIAFSDDEEDWLETGGPLVRVHSTPAKLTCAPDVTTSETTTASPPAAVEPAATEPAIVARKSLETPATVEQGMSIFPLSDPLARYVPLRIRRIPSHEDWLMDSLKPNEA